jgi:methyl-coenzyme M reductase subunit D
MSNSPASEYSMPLPEVLIFPNRLLSASTTEKLMTLLRDIEHVNQITLHGENIPAIVNRGPNKGLPVKHSERRTIKYGEAEIELRLQVGRIYVEVDDVDNVQEVIDKIKSICDEILIHGYSIEVGRYSKYRSTLSDYMK